MSYRSLDRQYMIADFRLGDFLRPVLWRALGPQQVFLTSALTETLSEGAAAIATHLLPDMHHFNGRGAKDVVPLWRDAASTQPNLTAGLLEALAFRLGATLAPEDLFAYCYAVLSAPSYTTRFAGELELPGPRVPITANRALFDRASALGARLVWLHTYGERFVPPGERAGKVPQGAARYVEPIPQTAAGYPTNHAYDAESHELRVGEGVFAPVMPEVRGYSVSGLDVIGSWLDYRMKAGAGRRSSELDRIRPEVWPATFTDELLQLLWVVEHTVALGPALDETLAQIVATQTIPAADLPQPAAAERKPPG